MLSTANLVKNFKGRINIQVVTHAPSMWTSASIAPIK